MLKLVHRYILDTNLPAQLIEALIKVERASLLAYVGGASLRDGGDAVPRFPTTWQRTRIYLANYLIPTFLRNLSKASLRLNMRRRSRMFAARRCATEATRRRGFLPPEGTREPPRPPQPAADHTSFIMLLSILSLATGSSVANIGCKITLSRAVPLKNKFSLQT